MSSQPDVSPSSPAGNQPSAELFQRVITINMETMTIVKSLPMLNI
ncbi:hypothetical protein GGE16_000825 [Rhizobium leguminosarum]|uniref:Uncharacterized protein n=1 Tax=Rhizobium leguminosarum TaxID=384 RepID=A0AAE2SVU8_RHILE|nr:MULTISPECIES: hypothetical protein [Rhizobium]MBB4288809.1 hypothetical protein [Rhizobium leguminosarum]MBB4295098.1 hypothetical protein [Rhizobium leguminosarum]MBB4306491.1 hypothetical protein [Rhizobium leguminosarum]MBB4417928.1 hypothetical protein [Rhizobium leguminosarum]MBB4432773.1 hypothetical protein [Rhizobium esperanzae]